MSKKINPGQIIEIITSGLNYSPDGFAMGCYSDNNLVIFEEIDLTTFPSFNDFHGKRAAIEEGETAMVLEYIGRPERITRDSKFFKYDVYKILIRGMVSQIFRQNIKVV